MSRYWSCHSFHNSSYLNDPTTDFIPTQLVATHGLCLVWVSATNSVGACSPLVATTGRTYWGTLTTVVGAVGSLCLAQANLFMKCFIALEHALTQLCWLHAPSYFFVSFSVMESMGRRMSLSPLKWPSCILRDSRGACGIAGSRKSQQVG